MLGFAYDYGSYFEVIVTDGKEENSFVYQFGKKQDIEISIKEAKLLAELEVSKQNNIPIPV